MEKYVKKNKTPYIWLRKKIESLFERLGRLFYRNSVKTIVVVLLITCAVCSQLPKMLLDTSALGLLAKNDPIRKEYNKFINQFGNDEIIGTKVSYKHLAALHLVHIK